MCSICCLRLRAGALMDALQAETGEAAARVAELTPGIRSLQVAFDPERQPGRRCST